MLVKFRCLPWPPILKKLNDVLPETVIMKIFLLLDKEIRVKIVYFLPLVGFDVKLKVYRSRDIRHFGAKCCTLTRVNYDWILLSFADHLLF